MDHEELIRQIRSMSPFDLPIAVYAVEEPKQQGCEARVIECNDRFRRVFGISPEEPLPYLSSRFYRDPQAREDLRQKLEQAKQLGEDLEKMVIPLQARDRDIWALDFTRALSGSHGEQIGSICCLVDITQEENTRRLLDELPVGIYHLDAKDRVVECNRQFAEMIGYSVHEVLGRNVIDFYTEPGEAEEFRRRVQEQGTVRDYPLEVTTKYDETILTSVSSARIGGESYQGRVGAVTDISEEERYRQIIDHLPIGLFKIRRSKQGIDLIEHCNDRFAEIVGVNAAELIGQPIQKFHASEEAYSALLQRLAESDRRGEALENHEVEIRNNDDDHRIVQVNTRQIKNRRGEIVGRVGAAQDVTKQRKLQEKLAKLTSDIGAVLHAYTHTLTMLAQTLEPVTEFLGPDPYESKGGGRSAGQIIGRGDVMKVLEELRPRADRVASALGRVLAAREEPNRAGAWDPETWERLRVSWMALGRPFRSQSAEVAHAYFREVANDIQDSCRLVKPGYLSRELVRQLEQESQELGRVACLLSLASVKNAVVEMDSQVRALRENLTLEQREETKEDIDLLEFVNSAIASQAEYFFLRDIELRNRLSEITDVTKWVLRGSRRDLVRALGNLFHNAIKYSWSRTGESSRPWIELHGRITDGNIAISIENWGVPIPKEEEPLVFELGYRGRYSADRNRAGTGVGLHDSREVARIHRGDLNIHSRPTYLGDPYDYSRPFLTAATLTLPIFHKER